MDGNAIYGRLHDLRQLAGIVAAKLQDARPGTVLRIQEDFAEGCEYCLVLDVREGGFRSSGEEKYRSPQNPWSSLGSYVGPCRRG